MLFAVIMAAAVASATASSMRIGGPLHASCKADWTFGMSCDDAMKAMVDQMNAWTGADGCADGGEKCWYEYKSTEGNVVKGIHITPVHNYVDEMILTFTDGDSGSCMMNGLSVSTIVYAHLDMGTNFCNMKNLITGAGLDMTEGFSETASDDTCTQYSTADCDKY